jgi:phosphatidate cytidylyltransferase
MNETLVRSLSGAVFGALVIGLVYYSPWTNTLLWAFVSTMAVREFKMGSKRASLATVWGFAAFVALWMCIVIGLPWQYSGAYEPSVVLSLVFTIWAADSGAYFVGKPLGRHKLMRSVSPGKSWEGLIGGVASAAIVAYFLWGVALLWVGPLLAVLGTAGDLLESSWKRRNGLKDSGAIMPGHGGVMDRFDGFVLTAPVYFVLLSLLPFEFALKAILP